MLNILNSERGNLDEWVINSPGTMGSLFHTINKITISGEIYVHQRTLIKYVSLSTIQERGFKTNKTNTAYIKNIY